MRDLQTIRTILSAGLAALAVAGCQPQTAGQKVENAAEDAAHETKQGVERAKETVQ